MRGSWPSVGRVDTESMATGDHGSRTLWSFLEPWSFKMSMCCFGLGIAYLDQLMPFSYVEKNCNLDPKTWTLYYELLCRFLIPSGQGL